MGSNQVWHNLPLPSKTNPFNCPFFIFYHHCRCTRCIYFFNYFISYTWPFFLCCWVIDRVYIIKTYTHTHNIYIHFIVTTPSSQKNCFCYCLFTLLYSLWVVSKQFQEKGLQRWVRERVAKCSQTLKKSKYTYFTR